jgi:hypothetical protein
VRSLAFSPDDRLLFVGLFNGAGQFFSARGLGRSARACAARPAAAVSDVHARRPAALDRERGRDAGALGRGEPPAERLAIDREPGAFVATVFSHDGA